MQVSGRERLHEAKSGVQARAGGAERRRGAGIRAGLPMCGMQAAGTRGAQRGCPQPSLLPFELTAVPLERCGHAQLVHCGCSRCRSIQHPQRPLRSLLQGPIAAARLLQSQNCWAKHSCSRDADLNAVTQLQGPLGFRRPGATSPATGRDAAFDCSSDPRQRPSTLPAAVASKPITGIIYRFASPNGCQAAPNLHRRAAAVPVPQLLLNRHAVSAELRWPVLQLVSIIVVVVPDLAKAGRVLPSVILHWVTILLLGHRVACMGRARGMCVPGGSRVGCRVAAVCMGPFWAAPRQHAAFHLSNPASPSFQLPRRAASQHAPAATSLQPRPLTFSRLPCSGLTCGRKDAACGMQHEARM